MPVLPAPLIRPPYFMLTGDLETIVPSLFRKVNSLQYSRERITTPDGDFLDLDWALNGSDKLAIISHGLEGDSGRPYVKGMAQAFLQAGYDVLAWNYRGCSGEANRVLRSYHSGATDDLDLVVEHATKKTGVKRIVLIGFSLGGNLTLKYLGERGNGLHEAIKCGIAFSVPCDLQASAIKLGKWRNGIYQRRFLKSLRAKLRAKQDVVPAFDLYKDHQRLTDFFAFDNYYTAPAHGFASAEAYYKACSSKQFLPGVAVPTLIVNALNDPFLSSECFPEAEARHSNSVFLEMPVRGGHVGFCLDFGNNHYYSEQRAVAFAMEFV